MRKIKVLSVFGTRPEANKMCPLVKALEASERIDSLVCTTGQHREMLHQSMEVFGVTADYALDIMRDGQGLADITARVLTGMQPVYEAAGPDLVLVHGDTTTSLSAALSAFYSHLPVGHVEAGLRTQSIALPYPEELNRRLTTRMAALHFAPTAHAAANLLREGVTEGVYVTGNTAIDTLRYTVRQGYAFSNEALRAFDLTGRFALITAHRRENWGEPIAQVCRAVLALAREFADLSFVFPVHLNPTVRNTVFPLLSDHPRILLTDPLDALDMHNLMAQATLILSDSGGLQEEAPALHVPVVVLRGETERPEAVESGTVILAGTGQEDIARVARRLLTDPAAYEAMQKAVNPYGDGHASEKIVGHILTAFGSGMLRLR